MDNSPVSQLDREHLDKVLALRPEAATQLGLSEGAESWGESGGVADTDLAQILSQWVAARAAIDASQMSKRDVTQLSMDQTVLEGTLRMMQAQIDRGPASYADPDLVTPRLQVLVRQAFQFCDAPEGAAALAARVEGLGASLAAAKANVVKADTQLLHRARAQLGYCRAALADLVPLVLRRVSDPDACKTLLDKAVEKGQGALDQHADWLKSLPAEENLAQLGQDGAAAFVTDRRWEMEPAHVEDLCRVHIDQMGLELRRTRRRAFKRQSAAEAIATSRSQAPYSAEEAASWLQELAVQGRQFCLESALFPLTDDEVVVEDAPRSLHDALGGIVFLPPATEPEKPPIVIVGDAGDEAAFTRLSVADLEALSARWLFPGACLHASLGRREHSFVRQGVPLGIAPALASTYGQDLTLGWRLYCEELMRELQFRESPAARIVLCERSHLDGLLGWYDIRLALGTSTPDEAVAALCQHSPLYESDARKLVWGLLCCPGQAAGAIVGKARLSQLRRSAHIKWHHGYSDRRFHDFVLSAGALPVAILFGLLDEFSPFSVDEGTVEYELEERPEPASPVSTSVDTAGSMNTLSAEPSGPGEESDTDVPSSPDAEPS